MKTILLSRTDKIGDVVLTLPMTGMIKKHFPQYKILLLVRGYTNVIGKRCSYVDDVYDWNKIKSGEEILPHIDIFIHVFPDREVASFAKKLKIKNRIGTSHRIYHWWTCNRLVHFSRKRGDLHESQLNMKLLQPLGITEIPHLTEMPELSGWKPFVSVQRQSLEAPLGMSGIGMAREDTSHRGSSKFNLILHMKSMGSAKEWPSSSFLQLAKELPAGRFQIFVTGTAAEGKVIKDEIPEIFSLPNVTDMTGRFDLNDFISFVEQCDGLVACSTGPLHIASIAGLKTLGLYPARRPMHAGRWAPVGEQVQVLAEKSSGSANQLDINVKDVRERIMLWV